MPSRDLARGLTGTLLWGAPIGVILVASAVSALGILTFVEAGALWIAGTAWLGTTCLVNARRCGRTHCWIDGLLLPPLAVVGGLILIGLLDIPWRDFVTALVTIVIGAFVVEWGCGPYLRRDARTSS